MNREEKNQLVADLSEQLADSNIFYLTDTSELDAVATQNLRQECFKGNITLRVVKNTLLKRAFDTVEGRDFSELEVVLAGPTAIMFPETSNAPAKLIQAFRKKHKKPLLKAAFIEEAIYIGDEQLSTLADLKSKEELIGDIIMLLQSPAKNVISALKSSGDTIAGVVKTLSEKQ